jgi:hypothetical protein
VSIGALGAEEQEGRRTPMRCLRVMHTSIVSVWLGGRNWHD